MKQLLLFLLLPTFAFSSVKNFVATYQQSGELQEASPPLPQNTITPAAGPLIGQDSFDFIIDAELLVWYSAITDLSYATRGQSASSGSDISPTQTTFVSTKKEALDRDWSPGLRLGFGAVTPHDGWDVYGTWTYFYNSYSNTSSVSPFNSSDFSQTLTGNPIGTKALTSPWFLNPNQDFFQAVRANGALLFNQIDLELGRKFWISCHLSLRPFAGVRIYWSRMHFSVNGSRPSAANADLLRSRSVYQQKSWAVGILTGLDTAWEFVRNWNIYAKGAIALPYGKTWIRRNGSELSIDGTGTLNQNLRATTHDAIYKTQPFIDLALGLRWDRAFDTFRILVDAGWESHLLINYNKLFGGTDLPSTNGDLTLAGVVIRGRIEF